jgi:hypothetical protein
LLGKREFVRGGAGGSAVGMPPKDDEDVDGMGEESDDSFPSLFDEGDDEDEEDEEDEEDGVEDGGNRVFGGEEEAVPALEVSSLNEADRTAGGAGSALDTTDPEMKRLRHEAVEKSKVVLNRLTTLLQVAQKGMKGLEELKHDAAKHERALSKVQRQSMALQLTGRSAAGGVPILTLSEQIPPEERFFRAALPVEDRGKEVQGNIFKFESRGWRRAETEKLRSELEKTLQSKLIRRVNLAHNLDTDAVKQKRKEIQGLSLSELCDRVGDELLRDSTVWESPPPSLLLPLPVFLLYTHSLPPYRSGRRSHTPSAATSSRAARSSAACTLPTSRTRARRRGSGARKRSSRCGGTRTCSWLASGARHAPPPSPSSY